MAAPTAEPCAEHLELWAESALAGPNPPEVRGEAGAKVDPRTLKGPPHRAG
jgi:hypothetical protein